MSSVKRVKVGLVGVALAAVAMILAGCDKEGYKLSFSHALHVTDNGMACADCHEKGKDGRFKMPGHEACQSCHEEWLDEKNVSEATCGKCHKVKNLKTELAARQAAPKPMAAEAPKSVFAHTDALKDRCAECHGVLMGKALTQVPRMSREDRLKLRDAAHARDKNCASCHLEMDPGKAPASHTFDWTKKHGVLSRQDEKACVVCHSEPSCRECHETTQPESHNNLWRLKTHGVQAAWDRQRCLVCHEVDSCETCHQETKPRSHGAGWRDRHCYECHTSKERGTGCALCHEGTIDAHPNPHPAGFRSQHCDTCHPGSPAARQCEVCHGGQLLENHSNPHSAGWRDQHCSRCHEDSSRCSQCHEGVTGLDTHPDPHGAGWRDRHCFTCHEGSAATECTPCHPGGNSIQVHQGAWTPIHELFQNQNVCYNCHAP